MLVFCSVNSEILSALVLCNIKCLVLSKKQNLFIYNVSQCGHNLKSQWSLEKFFKYIEPKKILQKNFGKKNFDRFSKISLKISVKISKFMQKKIIKKLAE